MLLNQYLKILCSLNKKYHVSADNNLLGLAQKCYESVCLAFYKSSFVTEETAFVIMLLRRLPYVVVMEILS